MAGAPFTQDGVTVVVHDVFELGWHKCARCTRYLPQLCDDVLFVQVCASCAETLHTMFYDVAHFQVGRRQHLPYPLREMSDREFSTRFCAPRARGLSWQECEDLG